MKKRILSITLALCLCMALLPLSASATYDYTWFNQKIEEIKRDYPEGTTWSNDNSYPAGWYGCWAFANIMAERIFGTSTPKNSWSITTIDSVVPGDILRSSDHTMFVIDVSGDNITLAEGNYGIKTHTIHYGRVTTKAVARSESFTVYHAPNYDTVISSSPRPKAPNKPTVRVNGAAVTVSWNDVANETSYNVYLVQAPWSWEDIKYQGSVGANKTSYTFDTVKPGVYKAFVISMPNGAEVQSEWTEFSVVWPKPTNQPSATVVGQDVTISWNNVSDEVGYNIYLVQSPWSWEDIKYQGNVAKDVTKYTFKNVAPGEYKAFVISMPNGAETQSPWVSLTVPTQSVPTEVSSITLNKSSLSMKTGESATLSATVQSNNPKDVTVTWSSSNTNVATVSGGKVTAVAAGTATITAKAGNKLATCTVTVSNATVEVSGISLNKTSLSLTTGGNATLTATVSPSNATDKTVTWSSSNTSIATVSGGKVTAVAAGTATITAKAGNKTATCTVTVSNATVAVTGLRLNKISLTLNPGATETLTATVMPSNATDQTVTWSSSDASIVTVDNSGKVTAIAAGTAKITAEAGGKTVTCTVTVSNKTVAVTGISLNKTTLTLKSGDTATLTATISPNNATDKNVVWTSDNEVVATVNNGVVTAVSAGKTTIRAQAGGKSQSCTVTVTGGEYLFEISAYVDGVTYENYGTYGMVDLYINGILFLPGCKYYSCPFPVGTTYEIKNVTPQDGYQFDGVYSGSLKGTISNGPINVVLQFSKAGSTSGNLYLDQIGVAMMVGGGDVILNPSNDTSFLAGHVVKWSSSDPSVATVSEGVVTPVSAGTAIITASYQGATATCIVTVKDSQGKTDADTPSSWAMTEVSAAILSDLVPEVLQKNYTKPVSRADVAQMFINLIEQSSGKSIDSLMVEKDVSINKDAFTDSSDYAVLAANALGIINGTGNSQFSPNGTFTRSQIAAIINRVARVLGVNTDGYTHSFTDVVGHWVDSELGWPSSVGIINGVGNNQFSPDTELTTEQAIAITYRALQILK